MPVEDSHLLRISGLRRLHHQFERQACSARPEQTTIGAGRLGREAKAMVVFGRSSRPRTHLVSTARLKRYRVGLLAAVLCLLLLIAPASMRAGSDDAIFGF